MSVCCAGVRRLLTACVTFQGYARCMVGCVAQVCALRRCVCCMGDCCVDVRRMGIRVAWVGVCITWCFLLQECVHCVGGCVAWACVASVCVARCV